MEQGRALTAADRTVRGYSWPPFEKGNRVALRHGAFSEQLAAETTQEITPRLFEVAPWLERPEFEPAIARYLRSEALSLLAFNAIERISMADGAEHVPRKLWQAHNAATNTAMRQASLLGLDPMSRERLAAARVADREGSLARLTAEGHAMRRAQGLTE